MALPGGPEYFTSFHFVQSVTAERHTFTLWWVVTLPNF